MYAINTSKQVCGTVFTLELLYGVNYGDVNRLNYFFRPLQSTHHTFLCLTAIHLCQGFSTTKHESQADCFSVENPDLGIDARITEGDSIAFQGNFFVPK